uniref:Glutathione synthetase n=1 Tax=Cyprinus carpio TaxID=7962 RepID=A0A8C1WML2_CYPCA
HTGASTSLPNVLLCVRNIKAIVKCAFLRGMTCHDNFTIKVDNFTARLFNIYRQVQHEHHPQSIVLGLNRSDYINIPVIRRQFEGVCRTGSLDESKRLFVWVDGREVAIVYFHNGYMPQNYTSERVRTHLSMLKIQSFSEMIKEGDKTVAIALANPDRYVLKAQREEGANNIYGSEICEVLENLKNSTERTAYILMDKIQPVPIFNKTSAFIVQAFLKYTALQNISANFCTHRKGKDTVFNECVGHLLRTKSSEHADGGVAAGVAVLDNPLLV